MAAAAGVAIATLLLAGCQNESVLVDEDVAGEGMLRAIGFDNTFIDRAYATRATAPLALSDYSSTMGVWGWRSDDTTTDQPQFIDQLVSYDTSTAKWQYSPLRYWETSSTYRFYAYAPHQTTTTHGAVTIDATTGHIAISDVVLTGTNLQDPPTAEQQYVFSAAAGDVDWLISRAGRANVPGRLGQTVEFTMQHILSKLNVAVRLNSTLASDASLSAVTIDKLLIGPFAAEGDFAQTLDHTPAASSAADRTAGEWTLTATPALTLSGATNVTLRNTANGTTGNTLLYIMESLVLPQDVADTQSVKLCYTFTSSDGRSEHFTYVMPLTQAFGPITEAGGQFLSGYSYTLTFTLGPDVITFDPGVDDWTPTIDATKQVN